MPFMFDFERFRNDVLALGLLALLVFVGLSCLSWDPADPPSDLVFPVRQTPINLCGRTGASVACYARQMLGGGIWITLAAVTAWDMRLLSRDRTRGNGLFLCGTALLVLFVAVHESYSHRGERGESMLLVQIVKELRRIAKRVRGIDTLVLYVGRPEPTRIRV